MDEFNNEQGIQAAEQLLKKGVFENVDLYNRAKEEIDKGRLKILNYEEQKKIISFFKKFARILIKTTVGMFILAITFSTFYWYNNRLFLWEASLLWPQEPFSELKFKMGSAQGRACMVVDLIRSQKIFKISSAQIHERIGEETGDYYHTDSNFTYRLTDKGNADWILTLIPGDDGRIRQVFIHKSCCSVSQKILYWGLETSEPIISKITRLIRTSLSVD